MSEWGSEWQKKIRKNKANKSTFHHESQDTTLTKIQKNVYWKGFKKESSIKEKNNVSSCEKKAWKALISKCKMYNFEKIIDSWSCCAQMLITLTHSHYSARSFCIIIYLPYVLKALFLMHVCMLLYFLPFDNSIDFSKR